MNDCFTQYCMTYHPLPPPHTCPLKTISKANKERSMKTLLTSLQEKNIAILDPMLHHTLIGNMSMRRPFAIFHMQCGEEFIPCVIAVSHSCKDPINCMFVSSCQTSCTGDQHPEGCNEWTLAVCFFGKYDPSKTRYMQLRMMCCEYAIKQTLHVDIHDMHCDHINIVFYNIDKHMTRILYRWSEEECMKLYDECSQWISTLQHEGASWDILHSSYPPDVRLFPNTSVAPDQYSVLRSEVSWRWKDLSLLWYVGGVTKEKLHNMGIYQCDDARLPQALWDMSRNAGVTSIQCDMLQRMFHPVVPMDCSFLDETDEWKQRIYIDVETTIDTETDQTQCNVIGIWYNTSVLQSQSPTIGWEYRYFASTDGSCVQSFHTWCKTMLPPTCIFVHYTAADIIAIPPGRHTRDLFDDVPSRYLSDEYPQIRELHINNFKLKTLYKAICTRLHVVNEYDHCKCKDGLQALGTLQQWKDTHVEEYLQEVLLYNKVDVKALYILDKYLFLHKRK